MKTKRHRFPRVNGRRGAFQLLFGTVYACLTAATLLAKSFTPAMAWIGEFAPPSVLAIIWAPPTIAAFIGAFLPRPKDAFSFIFLTFAPTAFGCLYLIGGLALPQGTSFFGVVVYWALAGAVMVVSGMTGDRDRDERKVKTWSPG
jgi:hypothetical protein